MNIVRRYQNRCRYRDTVNELVQLSNRELSDIGIAREDTGRMANRAIRNSLLAIRHAEWNATAESISTPQKPVGKPAGFCLHCVN